MRTNTAFLFAGFNARAEAAAAVNDNTVERFRDPCAICRNAEGTYDAHPHLRDGFVCKECFEAHVEPVRLRIIERARRWAAMV